MTSSPLSEIIKSVAQTESTPELAQYWQKRYLDILNQNLFKLSDKTEELAVSTEIVDRPATPFGDILLLTHTDKNKNLDEVKIQSTIETSVRLLDGILEIVKFTPEAREIVCQYRKIGVGILDFEEYMETKDSDSEIQQIDYIGNLLSTTCYHASESIAEEKGTCLNWNKINRHLRPKSFEYWYNEETGETRTGLELTEDFDQETILQSKFFISPRRNSNILLYSPDLEWQIWSDRDDTAPHTEITIATPAAPEIELKGNPKILIEDNQDLNTFELTPEPKTLETQEQIDELKEVFEPQEFESKLIEEDFQSEPQMEQTQTIANIQENTNLQETMPQNNSEPELKQNHGNFFTNFFSHKDQNQQDMAQTPVESEVEPENEPVAEEIAQQQNQDLTVDQAFETEAEQQKIEELPTTSFEDQFNPDVESDMQQEITESKSENIQEEILPASGGISQWNEPQEEEPLPIIEPLMGSQEAMDDEFQIGELVKVKDVSTEYYDHIYQIIEITEDEKYRLTGADDSLELILWKGEDLEYIDLHELLTRINSTPENNLQDQPEQISDEQINEIVEERLAQKVSQIETQNEARIEAEVNQRLAIVQTDHRNIDQEVALRVQEQMSEIQQPQVEQFDSQSYIQELDNNFEAKVEAKVLEHLNTPEFQARIDKLAIEKMNAKAQKIATKKTISTMQMMRKYQDQK
jgi:hypothetical protein